MMCFGAGCAIEEVPFVQPPLLALHDQGALSRQHEERLLSVLAVVHPDPLTGFEHADVDAEMREPTLALERAIGPERAFILPARIAGIHDEPALAIDNEAVLAHPNGSLRHGPESRKAPA
jgi:hypothetical protein